MHSLMSRNRGNVDWLPYASHNSLNSLLAQPCFKPCGTLGEIRIDVHNKDITRK